MKRSKKEMLALVAQYQNSKLTRDAFATKHNISKATLCYWIKKQKTSDSGTFIALSPEPIEKRAVNLPQIELDFPNGVTLRTTTTDLSLISSLIRLL